MPEIELASRLAGGMLGLLVGPTWADISSQPS
jgi:hypothetical protein